MTGQELYNRLAAGYDYDPMYAEVITERDKLMAENAKLRELLADTLIDPRDYCAKYGIDYDGWDSANDDIDRRLRELRIEVPHD